jgi:hypothetical protein
MRDYYVIVSPILMWLLASLFMYAAFNGSISSGSWGSIYPNIVELVCVGLIITIPISGIIIGRGVIGDLWRFPKNYGFVKSFTLLAVLIDVIIVCIIGYILLGRLLFEIASIFR